MSSQEERLSSSWSGPNRRRESVPLSPYNLGSPPQSDAVSRGSGQPSRYGYGGNSAFSSSSSAHYDDPVTVHYNNPRNDLRGISTQSRASGNFQAPGPYPDQWTDTRRAFSGPRDSSTSLPPLRNVAPFDRVQVDHEQGRRSSTDSYNWEGDESPTWAYSDSQMESHTFGSSSSGSRHPAKAYPQRRPSNRDEFDGPHQFLDKPALEVIAAQEGDLPHLPTNLFVNEQDELLGNVNDCLSKCAFDFVAKYQFPIPLEADKRPVKVPGDREWTEWVFLLKRLATKRRIPARVLYNGQIKQLVTVLENSLEMRHAAKHQSRPLKDDRNVLQLVSAGLQVAKILKDAVALKYLDRLYIKTEDLINSRKRTLGYVN